MVASIGTVEVVISAGIRGGSSREVGTVEVPVRVVEDRSAGLAIDTSALGSRIKEFAQAVVGSFAEGTQMHPRLMADAVASAADQEFVVIFAESNMLAVFLDEFLTLVPEADIAKVRRTNGDQEITLNGGGRLMFRSLPGCGGRSLRADRAFIPIGTSKETMLDVLPMVETSPVGLIIGYTRWG